jgi:hypothetical protein
MSLTEYQVTKALWLEPEKPVVIIQVALVGPDMCLIILDKNKLMTISVVQPENNIWYSKQWGPCPIQEMESFKDNLLKGSGIVELRKRVKPIYLEMTSSDRKHLWNGVGTSHAAEILHLARIHPEHPTNEIFQKKELWTQLIKGIEDFFNKAYSTEYLQRVPAKTSTTRAFEFPPSITKYINSQFTKVYRQGEALVPYNHYQFLYEKGLLAPDMKSLEDDWEEKDPDQKKKKKLEVYTVAFMRQEKRTHLLPIEEQFDALSETSDGAGSESSSGNKKKGKKKTGNKGKKVSCYTNTVIYKQPPGAKALVLTKEESKARRLVLDGKGKRAEIGIASFMDTIKEVEVREEFFESKFSKKVNIRKGKVGRPTKRKFSYYEKDDGSSWLG